MVALVCARACRFGALLFPAYRDAHQWFTPLGWTGTSYLSALRAGKACRDLFSRRMVYAARKSGRQSALWVWVSARNRRFAGWAYSGRSRSWDDGFARNNCVCRDVRRWSESAVAWYHVVGRSRGHSHRCHANLGTDGKTFRLSSSAKFQGRCWFAADAGLNRVGQRWNGRAWPGQWSPEDALSALRAHRFHFSDHRRRARSAGQSARGLFIRGHHCLRDHDRVARQRSFRLAARVRRCIAPGSASSDEHRRDHIALAEQRAAAAIYQLWRFESRRMLVRDRFVAEYLSAGHS